MKAAFHWQKSEKVGAKLSWNPVLNKFVEIKNEYKKDWAISHIITKRDLPMRQKLV